MSVGAELLVRYGDLLVLHEHLVDAGEDYAARLVQQALDTLEHAHRCLPDDGTAIVNPGQPEPVDTWPAA